MSDVHEGIFRFRITRYSYYEHNIIRQIVLRHLNITDVRNINGVQVHSLFQFEQKL